MLGRGKSRKRPAALLTGVDNVRCDGCGRDVSFSLFFRCAECPEFYACPDCFRGHDTSHGYQVPNALAQEIFDGTKWSAREELRLLKAIRSCGLGNWDHAALLVRTKKARECEDHFFRYLAPGATGAHAPGHAFLGAGSGLGLGLGSHSNPNPNPNPKPNPSPKPLQSLGDADFVARAGFMPLRGDYEVEPDDDAEEMVADLEFDDGDSTAQRELKLERLRSYHERLQERYRCKDFALEYGSDPSVKATMDTRRRKPEDTGVAAALRPFARFHGAAAHAALIEDLLRARRLRRRMADLCKYRADGMLYMGEVAVTEARAHRRKIPQFKRPSHSL